MENKTNKTNKTNDSKSTGRGPMVTVRLSNGKLMRIPFNNYKETLDRLEKNLALPNKINETKYS